MSFPELVTSIFVLFFVDHDIICPTAHAGIWFTSETRWLRDFVENLLKISPRSIGDNTFSVKSVFQAFNFMCWTCPVGFIKSSLKQMLRSCKRVCD